MEKVIRLGVIGAGAFSGSHLAGIKIAKNCKDMKSIIDGKLKIIELLV